jgi:hypothetical protein
MPELISNLAAVPAATAATRAGASGIEVIKITQPLDNLLALGETVDAEVVSVKAGAQNFQLLLRLSLAGGGVATVTASSVQPLPQGTSLLVSQMAGGAALVAAQERGNGAPLTLTRIDTQALPVGTLLQGKVSSSQVLAQVAGQPAVYRAMVTLLNTAQAGNILVIESPQPLRLGSLLSARVSSDHALNFVPLSGRMDQLAVAQQLGAQQARQGSLDSLLTALQSMRQDPELAPQTRGGIERLLASLPNVQQMTDPKTVAQAVVASGAFLEANLLNGQPAPDLKSAVLRLMAQIAPGPLPNPATQPAVAANVLAQVLPGRVRNALNAWGQVSEKPVPVSFPLPARATQKAEGEDDLEHLLRLAGAAVARLQSHQLAGLEQTGRTPEGAAQTTWQLEIPMRHLQEFVPLQVKVQREDPPPDEQARDKNEPRTQQEKIWRLDLAFDLDALGPLQVQAQLAHGSLSSQLWAQRPATALLIENQLDNLRQRLQASGLNVADLQCHQGTAPQGSRTRLEQRWVDETA